MVPEFGPVIEGGPEKIMLMGLETGVSVKGLLFQKPGPAGGALVEGAGIGGEVAPLRVTELLKGKMVGLLRRR